MSIFMTMRKIKLVELLGVRFALVDVMKESELTVAAMKKQQKKYYQDYQYVVKKV